MDPHARGRSPVPGTVRNKAPNSRSPAPRPFQDSQQTVNPSSLFQAGQQSSPFPGAVQQQQRPSDQSNNQSVEAQFGQGSNLFAQGQDLSFDPNTSFDNFTDQLDFLPSDSLSNNINFNDPTLFDASQVNNHSAFGQQGQNASPSAGIAPQYLSRDMQSHSNHSTPGLHRDGFESGTYAGGDSRRESSGLQHLSPNVDYIGSAFQNHRHRRTASDQYSDISSHPSPALGAQSDSFDFDSHSPNMGAQVDPGMTNALGFEGFSLNDSNQPQLFTPGHSSHPSPNVLPQTQGLPNFATADTTFDMLNDQPGMYQDQLGNGGFIFNQHSGEAFPPVTHSNSQSPGLDTKSPPEIQVEFAPEPTPNEAGHPRSSNDALSPPTRSTSRPRGRATSDPFSRPISRSVSPMRNRAPSLGVSNAGSGSLSPYLQNSSRSPSPSASGSNPNGVQKVRRNSSPNRSRVLDLAGVTTSADGTLTSFSDKSSPGGIDGAKNNRGQKHPATFQCHLCPKRFTRAYNLRSHLRTHTDERPFVCSVCGKAFARQHDRKRHEGLHTGEKKFVCRGTCTGPHGEQITWGCARRFARADALGRHFRSEAGRACIKPLMDEEARERRADQMEQASQSMLNAGMPTGAPNAAPVSVNFNGMPLPAALLQQYPALADIQWNAIPGPGMPGHTGQDDDYDISPRSSFDASSGGELDFDEDDYLSSDANGWEDISAGMQPQQQQQQQGMHNQQAQWGS